MHGSFPPSPRLQRRLAGTAIVLGLGTVFAGFVSYLIPPPDQASWLGWVGALDWSVVLFNLGGLLVLNAPSGPLPDNALFVVARTLAVATAAVGIAFLIVSLYREGADWLKLRVLDWRSGVRHTVICGLGRVGMQLVDDLHPRDGTRRSNVVVIEADPGNPVIEECRERGVTVIIGDARSEAVRRRARVEGAAEVFIVTGDDATNLAVAEDIRADVELAKQRGWVRRGGALECYTNIIGHTLAQAADGNLPLSASAGTGTVFHIFNTDDNAARQLLLHDEWGLARSRARHPAPAGEDGTIRLPERVPAPDEVAHYLVFGFGALGQAVALQMARLAHFSNLKRLRLTVLDRFESDGATARARVAFLDRHPGFCPEDLDLERHVRETTNPDGWASREARPAAAWRIDEPLAVEYAVNAEFVDLASGVDAPELLNRLLIRVDPPAGPRPRMAAVLCFEDERENFEAALRLQSALRVLHEDGALRTSIPVYVHLPDEKGLRDIAHRRQDDDVFPILPFGRRQQVANHRQITRIELRRMAKAAHELYRRISAPEMESWERLEPALRASSEDAAAHADIKLDLLGWRRLPTRGRAVPPPAMDEEQLAMLAQVEHNRWMGERLAAGWRYGAPQGSGAVGNKRRTSFRAWEHLEDRGERIKDEQHVQALGEMFAAAGYVIVAPEPDRARPEVSTEAALPDREPTARRAAGPTASPDPAE